MRPVKYSVATSLDGFIAGPNGEIDWIRPDPALDFATIYAQFDTALLGRRTYELTRRPGAPPWPGGWDVYVISTTIHPSADPAVHIINTDVAGTVARLRRQPGKAIWLFGGGVLFASLLADGQVDELELAVMPVLLGRGVPLLHPGGPPVNLSLLTVRESSNGIVRLSYRVNDAASQRGVEADGARVGRGWLAALAYRIVNHAPQLNSGALVVTRMTSAHQSAGSFVERYRALGLNGSPSSEAQVRDLQSTLGLTIPSAYAGFLLTMGVEPDEFFRGTDCRVEQVPQFRAAASRLLQESGLSDLPENAIVFAMHQGYEFLYISCDGSEDPPVFHYLDRASSVERKFERFSQWVELCAEEKRDD